MKLDLTDMLYALSFALDEVEAELVGVDTGHGKRVAYLAVLMGKEAGFADEELRDFIGCCLLHDNALTEFIREELAKSPMSDRLSADILDVVNEKKPDAMHDHSVLGEQNIRLMPFRTDVNNIILYHHENADGSGTLGLTASEIPLKSEILHLADTADASLHLHLKDFTPEDFEELCSWVEKRRGKMFSDEVVDLFKKAVTYEKLEYLRGKDLLFCLHEELHKEVLDYTDAEIHNIAKLFSRIIDYKSEFTEKHSTGVANMAEVMAHYYDFGPEKSIRFYFAGAMHDIGKLAVVNDILEKPGKLTEDEFAEMKNHAVATRYVLSEIGDMPDIVEWASNHHERLDGSGYPQGLTADELSFEEQLMACIDVYQALTEIRPYKDGIAHEEAISTMKDMASKGEINAEIVEDLDKIMREAVI